MSRALDNFTRWIVYILAAQRMADGVVHQFADALAQPWRALLSLALFVVSLLTIADFFARIMRTPSGTDAEQ